MKTEALKQFHTSWQYIRAMTLEYVKNIPEEHWMATPHKDYSPFAKQVRHMVWVSGLYNDALLNKKLDLKNKKTCYAGELEREKLLQGLNNQNEILFSFLNRLTEAEANEFSMDFFGSEMGLYEFLNNMIQHETMHHGMWALYAKTAGFPIPAKWKQSWSL